MKAEDLMIGDWINLNFDVDYKTGNPIYGYAQVTGINKDGTIDVNCTYDKSESMQDGWDLKLIEPIPLTVELLEKNGCRKWTWHNYPRENVITYAIGDGFQIEITKKNGFWMVDNCSDSGDYGYESNWIADVNYVHKLQHLIRDLEIKKEIIL